MLSSYEAALKLLAAKEAQDVSNLIENEKFFSKENCVWLPYGGRESNAGQIDGQANESVDALVEKVTNSIDSILMKKSELRGEEPANLALAVRSFFGDELANEKKRLDWAKRNLLILLEGKDKGRMPTITIADKGQGQSADGLKNRIFSLDGDLKERLNYVYGKYNQGGAAAIKFCGNTDHCYQLVITKRAKGLSESGGKWSFSLVRRESKNRTAFYTYCCGLDNMPFTFDHEGPLDFGYHEFNFDEGCLIRLYEYSLKHSSSATFGNNSLLFDLNEKFQRIPLPACLVEARDYKGSPVAICEGLMDRIKRSDYVHDSWSTRIGLGRNIGDVSVECVLLKHKRDLGVQQIDLYSRNTKGIYYLDNGMSIGSETKAFLRNDCQLPYAAGYLICYLDMSNSSVRVSSMFNTGRNSLNANEDYFGVVAALKEFFKGEKFIAWEAEYRNKSAALSVKSPEVTKRLEKLIRASSELARAFDFGNDFQIKGDSKKGSAPYLGGPYPLKLEFLGDNPKVFSASSFGQVSFATEAEDRVLEEMFDFAIVFDNDQAFDLIPSGIKNGVIKTRMRTRSDITIGSVYCARGELREKNKLDIIFSTPFSVIVSEEPAYSGAYYPSFITLETESISPKIGQSRKIILRTDVSDDYFERPSDRGKIEIRESDQFSFDGFSLSKGKLQIKITNKAEKIGLRFPMVFNISDNNGFNKEFVCWATVVDENDADAFRVPEIREIYRKDWQIGNWDGKKVSRANKSGEVWSIEINCDADCCKGMSEAALEKWIQWTVLFTLFGRIGLESKPESGLDYGDSADEIFEKTMDGMGVVVASLAKELETGFKTENTDTNSAILNKASRKVIKQGAKRGESAMGALREAGIVKSFNLTERIGKFKFNLRVFKKVPCQPKPGEYLLQTRPIFAGKNARKCLLMYLKGAEGLKDIDEELTDGKARNGYVAAATLAYYGIPTSGTSRGSLRTESESETHAMLLELVEAD